MPGRHFRNLLIAAAILVSFGVARLYLEEPISREMAAKNYWPQTMTMDTRDKVGQLGFTAALGGFRSLVASIMSVESFTHWDARRFDQAIAGYWVIVQLQPGSFFNWYQGHQYSAYDKAASFEHTETRRADWEQKYGEAVQEGADFLTEAAKFLPDDYRVYASMAELYRNKFRPQDMCTAAEYYKKAAECTITKPYYLRFYGYALAQCPGREKDGYVLLKEQYDEGIRFPSVITHLKNLEEFLNIPADERIPERRKTRSNRRPTRIEVPPLLRRPPENPTEAN